MPKRPAPSRRWLTAATWPVGIALTSWDYMWRTTPMHRQEAFPSTPPPLPELPTGVSAEEVQGTTDGTGPLYHRRYRTWIRDCRLGADELMDAIQRDPNAAAPTTFARFQRVDGGRGRLSVGDEFVVRMPGPWDGPVRVVHADSRSFRLATLAGHLEAGQIEFRIGQDGEGRLVFEIESWARSSSRLVHLLYHRLRMAKEVQAHMWISFLERVVRLSGGRMTGGIELHTERINDQLVSDPRLTDSPGIARRLAALADKPLNFDPAALRDGTAAREWDVTDVCQRLPDEPPGPPVDAGSWQIARRLMQGYEFADPSIVRAYYDPELPLAQRDMLLKLKALRVLHLFAGVRVCDVYEETRQFDGQRAQVWGWSYRTLAGHVEMGQMDWEIWKWLGDGRVEFRVHAVSRPASIPNPLVRIGFHLLRRRERRAFLASTQERMRRFTELALEREGADLRVREAAAHLTARPASADEPAHDAVADSIRADAPAHDPITDGIRPA